MEGTSFKETVKELESELDRIDKKYNNLSSDDRIKDTPLEQLLKEFDSLGIACNQKDIVPNTLQFINIYRRTLQQVWECKSELAKEKTDNLELKKKIASLEKEVSKKDLTVDFLQKKSTLNNLDKDQLKTDKEKLHSDLQSLRKVIANKEHFWENRFKQLANENTTLRDQIEKNVGSYRSENDVIAETITRYKRNEEIYKDTIEKLQDNTRHLMQEILNLKEEVLLNLISFNTNCTQRDGD